MSGVGIYRQRLGPVKGNLTQAIQQSAGLVNLPDAENKEEQNAHRIEIERALSRLKARISTVQQFDKEYVAFISTMKHADATAADAESKKYMDTAYGTDGHLTIVTQAESSITELEVALDECKSYCVDHSRMSTPNITQHVDQQNSQQNTMQHRLKLPSLQIPQFDGKIENWSQFWEIFRIGIHDTNLPTCQKYDILLRHLKDDAKTAMAGAIETRTYDGTIDWLQEEYGNPEKIIKQMYKRIAQLPHVPELEDRTEQITCLRRTLHQLDTIYRQLALHKCDLDAEANRHLTIPVLMAKLPENTRMLMTLRKDPNDNWTFTSFCTSLRSIIKFMEELNDTNIDAQNATYGGDKASNSSTTKSKNKITSNVFQTMTSFNSNPPQANRFDQVPTYGAYRKPYNTSTANRQAQRQPKTLPFCPFCEEQHYADRCEKLTTAQARVDSCKRERRCLRCLTPDHYLRDCPSGKTCYYCKRTNHHSALCFTQFPTKNNTTQPINQNIGRRDDQFPSTNTTQPINQNIGQRNVNAKKTDTEPTKTDANRKENTARPITMMVSNEQDAAKLMTATACIHRIDGKTTKKVTARILFDTASTDSYVSEALCHKLYTQEERKNNESMFEPIELQIKTFAGTQVNHLSHTTPLLIMTDETYPNIPLTAYTVPNGYIAEPYRITVPPVDLPILRRMKNLAEPITTTTSSTPVDILIGIRHYFEFIIADRVQKLPSGLHVIQSKIGSIYAGATYGDHTAHSLKSGKPPKFLLPLLCQEIIHHHPTLPHSTDSSIIQPTTVPSVTAAQQHHSPQTCTKHEETDPNDEHEVQPYCTPDEENTFESSLRHNINELDHYERVKLYWDNELAGITELQLETDEDRYAKEQVLQGIHIKDKRLTVPLPWAFEHPILHDNRSVAYTRLKQQYKKFCRDSEYRDKYTKVMDEQYANHIQEPAPEGTNAERIYYLPHHAVTTPGKATTKFRVVCDASSKAHPDLASLNECLLRGPVKPPDIAKLILYFRQKRYIILADIEKAFLQMALDEKDRDAVRMLWTSASTDPESYWRDESVQVRRFARVPFGLKSSPYLLEAALDWYLSDVNTPNSLNIRDRLYVDNVLVGFNDEEQLIPFYKESKHIFAAVSMNLREFISNHTTFMTSIDASDRARHTTVSMLGVPWCSESDQLYFNPLFDTLRDPTLTVTKRVIQSETARCFDPCGLIAPLITPAKRILQSIHKLKVDWDIPLPDSIVEEWKETVAELSQLRSLKIDRYIPIFPHVEHNLHVFVDASAHLYAAAVYIVPQYAERGYLLISKNAITPSSKTLTIPRLELLAILMGVKLVNYIKNNTESPLKETHIWSDSSIALNWIKSTSDNLGRYINNRLKVIRESEGITFHHVSTEDNPADYATRQASIEELQNKDHLWWTGPKFLSLPSSQWPESTVLTITAEVLEKAAKQREAKETTITMSTQQTIITTSTPPILDVDYTRFSKIGKLERTVLYVLRFLKRCSAEKILLRRQTEVEAHSLAGLLTQLKTEGQPKVHEMKISQMLLAKIVQHEQFQPELQELNKTGTIMKWSGLKTTLNKDGIMVAQSRFPDTVEYTQPIILPPNHRYTALIIEQTHRQLHHGGVKHTLAEVQKTYWPLRGRQVVKKTLRNCVTCKRIDGGCYQLPDMPTLPTCRLQPSPPFMHTGADYFGPIHVKDDGNHIKRWVLLFTCLTTRNVHLEIVMDSSAAECLLALRRFIARRGAPAKMLTDNGSAFVLVNKTLQSVQKDSASEQTESQTDLIKYTTSKGITWKFITAFAPWSGGIYERMVGIVKRSMKAAIGKRLITTSELNTITVETEAIVNSRPLSYVYTDEVLTPLRPCDFLLMNKHTNIQTPDIDEGDEHLPKQSTTKSLTTFWSNQQVVIQLLWQKFQEEYLQCLRERQQIKHRHHRVMHNETPQIDDVVLIQEEITPRGAWKMGRIVQLDEDKRAAKLKLPSGRKIDRPVNKLVYLESHEDPNTTVEASCEKTEQTGNPENNNEQIVPRRSPRIAGLKTLMHMAIMFTFLITSVNADIHCEQITLNHTMAMSFNIGHGLPNSKYCIENLLNKRKYVLHFRSIDMTCDKHVKFFTRSYHVLHSVFETKIHSPQCETEAQCRQHLTMIPTRPPTGISVEGCFVNKAQPDHKCIFHRKQVEASSPDIYEIFECKRWTTKIKLSISEHQNTSTIFRQFSVGPGEIIRWRNIHWRIIPRHFPTEAQNFFPDKAFVAMKGIAVPYTTSPFKPQLQQLVCATREKAELMNCTLDPNICQCTTAPWMHSPKCNCPNQTLDTVFFETFSRFQNHEQNNTISVTHLPVAATYLVIQQEYRPHLSQQAWPPKTVQSYVALIIVNLTVIMGVSILLFLFWLLLRNPRQTNTVYPSTLPTYTPRIYPRPLTAYNYTQYGQPPLQSLFAPPPPLYGTPPPYRHERLITQGLLRIDTNLTPAEERTESENSYDSVQPVNNTDPSTDFNVSAQSQEQVPVNSPISGTSPSSQGSPSHTTPSQSTTSIFMVSSLMLLCIIASAQGYDPNESRCPFIRHQDAEEEYTLQYAENCVTSGYAIYQHVNFTMCWLLVNCNEQQHLNAYGECADKCSCGPEPKSSCTNTYNETNVARSLTNDEKDAIEEISTNYCSLEPNENCNSIPIKASLPFLQPIGMNTKIYSKNLNIVVEEVLDVDKVTCLGTGTRRSGTPEYCKRHPCLSQCTELCLYPRTEIANYISENGIRIPVRTWGYQDHITVYTKTATHHPHTCLECEINCIRGGVFITTTADTSLVEICSKPLCYEIPHPGEQLDMYLTPEISMHDHEVQMKIWKDGEMIYETQKHCPALPFCEQIQCYGCWARMSNPQCTPRLAFVFILIGVYFGTMTLYAILKLTCIATKILYITAKITLKTIRLLRRCLCHLTRKATERAYIPLQNLISEDDDDNDERTENTDTADLPSTTTTISPPFRFRPMRKSAIPLLITLMLIMKSQACSETATLSTQHEHCVYDKTNVTCTLNQDVQLTMVPTGQQACILIENDGLPLSTVTIEIREVSVKCIKQNHYFTRQFKIQTESIRRCENAGSCHSKKCQTLQPDEMVDEFSEESSKSPGFSHCVDSGRGWPAGCFLYGPSCLFYRYYASPDNDKIYEIFSCPSWEYRVQMSITVSTAEKDETKLITVHPGITKHWNKMKITLNNLLTPNLPLLNTQFITDMQRVAIVHASPAGQPITGTIGSLQCTSKEKAKSFDCFFNVDICNCAPRNQVAVCTCSEPDLSSLFDSKETLLPLQTPNAALMPDNGSVYAIIAQNTVLTATVSFDDAKIRTKSDRNRCTVQVKSAVGCYQCLTGIKLQLTCRSDRSRTLAHIDCEGIKISTPCTPAGYNDDHYIHSAVADVDTTCEVQCPGGKTQFVLKTKLSFIETPLQTNIRNKHNIQLPTKKLDSTVFSELLGSSMYSKIAYILLVGIAGIGTILLIPLITPACSTCIAAIAHCMLKRKHH